jgi:hypothetical protein
MTNSVTQRCVLWIVGEPGVGKTTIARALLLGYSDHPTFENQSPKWTGFGSAAAAGWWRGEKFDGADTLAISQIKPAMTFWRDFLHHTEVAIIDGDKLSNAGAVEVAREAGAKLICFLITGEEKAAERRGTRGTVQNATWVNGRRTKSKNFHDRFPGSKFSVDVSLGTDAIVQMMKKACQ